MVTSYYKHLMFIVNIGVNDADGVRTSTSTLPTINSLPYTTPFRSVPDQSTQEDMPTPAIAFTISDAETTASNLTLSGSSSNQGLVRNATSIFDGNAADRYVTIMSATNQFGTTTITLTVTDSDEDRA